MPYRSNGPDNYAGHIQLVKTLSTKSLKKEQNVVLLRKKSSEKKRGVKPMKDKDRDEHKNKRMKEMQDELDSGNLTSKARTGVMNKMSALKNRTIHHMEQVERKANHESKQTKIEKLAQIIIE